MLRTPANCEHHFIGHQDYTQFQENGANICSNFCANGALAPSVNDILNNEGSWIFDGVNDDCNGDSADFNFGANDFSAIIRFKFNTDPSGGTRWIFGKKSTETGADAGYAFYFNGANSRLRFSISDGTTNAVTQWSANIIDTTIWHVAVMRKSATAISLKVDDGSVVTTGHSISASIDNALSFGVGSNFGAASNFCNCSIAELIMVNEVIDASNIDLFRQHLYSLKTA